MVDIMNRVYLCIDLKSFYASVECVERGLDPFEVNLVVADPSRGKGAICLAVSPAMKALGVSNRCRIFDIPKGINYVTALPRMSFYIKYAAEIYGIYLKYVSKDDIHVYSIDESFLDITKYLKLYKMTAEELARKIIENVVSEIGITATAGIGPNMYLAKVALDITAKHVKSNIGYLDEEKYKKELWHHRPITDFWQVGSGIARRLEKYGIYDMYGVTQIDPKILYKEFGINAEYLIDHANGIEPTTIADIKRYKPKGNSISSGQILFEDYPYEKAKLALTEMVDLLSLDLVDKGLVTNWVAVSVGYSKDEVKMTGGSIKMTQTTNVFSVLKEYVINIFEKTTHKDVLIRRLNVGFGNLVDDSYEQLDLFTDPEEVKKEKAIEETMNRIKKKFGKSSILRGMNLEEGATTLKRNKLIGGHNSGEEE